MTPAGIAYKVAKWIFASDSVEKQGKTIEELIKAGKENGTNEMEITIENKKGFHVKAPLDDSIKIETTLEADENIKIKVKYK